MPAEGRAASASTGASTQLARVGEELVAWFKTLISAAVYATLIVTFGFQVARVEGQSMAPTLDDQDRLIVNKLAYRFGAPHVGDIVMLYYPLNPEKSFVKRVIAEEGDQVRIVDGRVYRNEVPLDDDYVPAEFRSHDDWGPEVIPEGYYFVMGDHRNNSSDSRHWGWCRRATSSARSSSAGGRCRRPDCSDPHRRGHAGSRAGSRRQPGCRHREADVRLLHRDVSIISDGFHSLTDSAANVVALVGIGRPGSRRRRSSLRPSQVRDADGRGNRRAPRAGHRSRSCARRCSTLVRPRRASRRQLRGHDRDARRQPLGRRLRSAAPRHA